MSRPGGGKSKRSNSIGSSASVKSSESSLSSSNMDIEKVFFRLHVKLIDRVTRIFPLWFLRLAEIVAFLNAVACLSLLVYLHVWFVSGGGNGGGHNCVTLSLLSQVENSAAQNGGNPADLVRISVGGIWSQLAAVDSKGAEAVAQAKMNGELLGGGAVGIAGSDLLETWLSDPVFLFSKERGFLLLDQALHVKHGITQANVTLDFECLGEQSAPLVTFMLDNFVGYQTVVLNVLVHAMGGKGFMYAFQSRDLVNLEHAALGGSGGSVVEVETSYSSGQFNAKLAGVLATKLGVAVTTLFLFFITSALVHHTLRETQGMMLQFTLDLQRRIEASMSTHNLIVNHVVNSLVFVPIMVGMLFFLFEFYNDQLLAFMLLALAWIGELFSAITMRTATAITWFPKLFCANFCAFHIYFFSCPSGFSYLALTTAVIFLHHAMLRCWCRYEIPAFRSGQISMQHPRKINFSSSTAGLGAGAHGNGMPPSLAYHALLGSSLHVTTSTAYPAARAHSSDTFEASQRVSREDVARRAQGPALGGIQNSDSNAARDRTDSHRSVTPTDKGENVDQSEPFFFLGDSDDESETNALEPVSGQSTASTSRRKKRVTLHNSPTLGMDSGDVRRRYTPGAGVTQDDQDGMRQEQLWHTRYKPGGAL